MLNKFNNLNLNTKNIIVLVTLVSTFMIFNITNSILNSLSAFEKQEYDKAYSILQASITASENILKEQENPDATKLLKRELVRALENSSDKESTVLNSGLYLASPFVAAERLGNKTANSKDIKVKYQQTNPKFKKDALNEFAKKAINISKNSGELFYFEINKSANIAHAFYSIKVRDNMLMEYGDIKSDIDGDGYDSLGYEMPGWNKGEIRSGFYISLDLNKDISALHSQMLISIISQFVIGVILIFLFAMILRKSTSYSIDKIKTGLDTFFRFLNKESNNCDTISVTTTDDLGKMAKSINENIIKTQKGIQEDNALIDEAKQVIEKVKIGDYTENINSNTSNQSLENFKNNVNDMIITTREHFKNLNNILQQYTSYNYTEELSLQGIKEGGAFCVLVHDINNLRDAITEMLVENKRNGLTLDKSSDILLRNVETLNNNSTTAAASLEETAAAIEELTGNVASNNANVQEMAKLASKVTNSANEGQNLASKTTTAMDQINVEVNAISEAISVIDQIAFQTNILSLNAAVEAATAGEAGKGFAVVAQEVRNLAARSAEAAKEIKDLVENATNKANEGKNIADSMIKGYEDLNGNISKTIDLIGNVETASKEQEVGIVQINDAVNSLDQQTQENASIAAQTNTIAIQTDKISKVVVESTDQKEFIGKDSVVADKIDNNTYNQPAKTKTVVKKEHKVSKQTSVKKTEPIVSQSGDDEWESF